MASYTVTIKNKLGGSITPYFQFVVQLCDCWQASDDFEVFVQYLPDNQT
jgi:hypothetical protein